MKCSFVNTVHMQRIFYCRIADLQLDAVLTSPRVQANRGTRDAWIRFREKVDEITRSETELLLASLPFYITPGPLIAKIVSQFVWPLSTIGTSRQVTSGQLNRAREALLEIGRRAMIPIATKLANAQFHPNAELSKEAHMLHLAWQF
jgi:hypothetical protein